MKHLKYLFIAFACFSTVCAQTPSESQKYLTETLSQVDLDKEELLPKFINFDCSKLWMKNEEAIIGFIGDKYERLKIRYLEVIKNPRNPAIYYVYGKSKVKSNVCQFMGEIELIHVRKINDPLKQQLYKEAKRQNDEDATRRFSKHEYILLAKYQYFEDQNQKSTGIFEGILKTTFYIDDGEIFYDDLDNDSDNYSNNQCVGTWTSYSTGASKKCNWGEFRIPYSGDLDVGVGDFSPSSEYLDKGWNIYYKAFVQNDTIARKEEELIWW